MIRFKLEDGSRNVILDGEVEDMQECNNELLKFYGFTVALMDVETIQNDFCEECTIEKFLVFRASDKEMFDTLYIVTGYEMCERDWDGTEC